MAVLDNQQSNNQQSLNANDNSSATLYYEGPGITNSYHIEQGVCVLPLAEDPPVDPMALRLWSPVVLLRLHSPYRIRKTDLVTKKLSAPPVIPSPKDTGAFVFLGGDLNFTTVVNGSQNFDWTVQTTYLYAEYCVSDPEDGFVLGNPGFAYPTQNENASSMGGTPAVVSNGAIFYAGQDAKIGWAIANGFGGLLGSGPYNTFSYFPGTFFNDNLMNGEAPTYFDPELVGGGGSF